MPDDEDLNVIREELRWMQESGEGSDGGTGELLLEGGVSVPEMDSTKARRRDPVGQVAAKELQEFSFTSCTHSANCSTPGDRRRLQSR